MTATVIQPIVPGEIWFYGARYNLRRGSGVTKTKATQYAAPVRTGPPERQTQQYASEVIWEDVSGGHGVINMDERENPDRVMDGDMNTMTRKLVTLPRKKNTVSVNGNTFNAREMYGVTYKGISYICGGTTIKQLVKTTTGAVMKYYGDSSGAGSSFVTSGGTEYALPDICIGKPIIFKSKMYIPCRTKLIQYNFSTATFAEVTFSGSSVPANWLGIYDEDLIVLQTDGKTYSVDETGTAVVSQEYRGAIDTFEVFNGFIDHRDLQGNPAMVATTESNIFILDYWNRRWYKLGIDFPDGNVFNGRAVTKFDGDLWHGRNGNILQITNGAQIVRGPSGPGDGLVSSKQGFIVDSDNTFSNFLVAAMDGGPNNSQVSTLWAFNRRGWNVLARTTDSNSATEFKETFDRSDNTSTLGSNWTAVNGTFGINNYSAYKSAGSGVDLAVTNTLLADCSVLCQFATVADGTRVIFRYSDSSNYLAVEANGGTSYKIIKRDAGSESTLATYTTTPANGDEIYIWMYGSIINVYINRILRIVTTSTFNDTATQHGIGSRTSSTTHRWDDFAVFQENGRINFCLNSASNRSGYPNVLFYNDGNVLKYIKIYDTTDNINQYIHTDYESTGTLEYPWFDGSLSEISKVGLAVEARTLDCTTTENLTFYFAKDQSDTFSQLYNSNGLAQSVTSSGVATMYFDYTQLGTLFTSMRIKVVGESGNSERSPKMAFLKIRYLRELPVLFSYRFSIDLTLETPDGRTPEQARSDIEDSLRSRLLGNLAYVSGEDGDTKTVLMLSYGGPEGSGTDKAQGYVDITCVEIVASNSGSGNVSPSDTDVIDLLTTSYSTLSTSRLGTTTSIAFVTVEGGPCRYWVDGSDPTSSSGHILTPGQVVMFESNDEAANAKFIATTTDTTKLMVTYYN